VVLVRVDPAIVELRLICGARSRGAGPPRRIALVSASIWLRNACVALPPGTVFLPPMKRTCFVRSACFGVLLLGNVFVISAAEPAEASSANKPDPWQPLRRLIGTWEGEARGESGAGQVQREYRFVLNNRFIEATNVSIYPPQEKNPKGERHEDRGLFSYDRAQKKIVLRQFHGEGFVNQYVLESVSSDGNTVVFVTTEIENIPPGWRARETYTFLSDDEFVEKFELAEPEKDFAPYSETRFKRKP
jgi:hypothetical protein